MEEIYNNIFKLVELIKNTTLYKDYKEAEAKLEEAETKALLLEQKTLHEKYLELRRYDKNMDLTDIREELRIVKEKVLANKNITSYYKAYHELNNMLEETSKLLFKDISAEIVTTSIDY